MAGAELEQFVRKTDFWDAAWRFKADYQGRVDNNIWLYGHDAFRQSVAKAALYAGLRAGYNLGMIDLLGYSNFEEMGIGLFLNSKRINGTLTCGLEEYCKLTGKLALETLLDSQNSRRQFLTSQFRAYSRLAGIESLVAGDQHVNYLQTPGLFFDFELLQSFDKKFPYHEPTIASLGISMLDPQQFYDSNEGRHNLFGINLHLSAKYRGNFVNVHGFLINFGSNYWDGFGGATFSKDKERNSNSTSATSGLALHLGDIDIVTRYELFPAPLDDQPHSKEIKIRDPRTQKGIKTYKRQHDSDFRILAELRANPELLEELLTLVPKPELQELQLQFANNWLKVKEGSAEIRLGYDFGKVNFFHEFTANNQGLELLNQAHYVIGYGLGPLVLAKYDQEENSYILPGVALDQLLEGHSFNFSAAAFYQKSFRQAEKVNSDGTLGRQKPKGMIANLGFRYEYDPAELFSSYARLEASTLFGWNKNQKFEHYDSHLWLNVGVRAGPIILSMFSGFEAGTVNSGKLGTAVGIDFDYLMRNKID